MKKLLAAIAVALLAAIAYVQVREYNFIRKIEPLAQSLHPYKVNDCELLMLKKNLTYVVCGIREDGTVVLRDDRRECTILNADECSVGTFDTKFGQGEYLCVHVNMLKLNVPYETYYTCIYSDIPIYETRYPGTDAKPGIPRGKVNCIGPYNRSQYVRWSLSGYTLNKPGKYTLMSVYVFDGKLPKNYPFKKRLNEGINVFKLEGEIE